jgi:hypothetical protein
MILVESSSDCEIGTHLLDLFALTADLFVDAYLAHTMWRENGCFYRVVVLICLFCS